MADDQEDSVNVEEEAMINPEWAWIGPEPRGIASEITPTALGVYTILEEEPMPGDFAAYNPKPDHRICSTFPKLGFGMYEFVFKELQLKLPFSALAVEIFRWLKLAPSQLHPNSMAFVIAFERVCEYKSVEPTRPLFFRIFKLQRSTNKVGQRNWVSLKQRVSLFDMFVESVRGFKSRYYIVRPETQTGIDALYTTEIERNEEGVETTKLVARFPMSWSKEHFEHNTEDYLTADASLTDAKKKGFEELQGYVKSFLPAKLVTRTGVPVLDEHGREQFVPRLINTKRLLECETRAEITEVLGSCFALPARFNMFA
jgi:hypothetical protein